jgi:hypothetical protein
VLRQVISRLLALLVGTALGLGLCEVVAGRVTRQDADGNRTLRSIRLKPYRLPVRQLRELVGAYHSGDSSYVVYSPELGWDARPRATRTGGATATPREPHAGSGGTGDEAARETVRIALFGDSFTAGNVPYREGWGYLLESGLRAHGVPAEVLNFGIGGYGLDQAFLRWRALGRRAAPDVVILGFQPENVKRDLNLVRLLYVPDTGLPFSKPRFVLENGRLELINMPAAPPESLPSIVAHLETWPPARYERFHATEDFRDHLWLKSSVLALAASVLADAGGRREAAERAFYDPAGEGGALALAIIRQFRAEAESTGASFAIVHLPRIEDLKCLNSGTRALPYADLLAELKRRHDVIETSDGLCRTARERGIRTLFGAGTHYVAAGNRIVADAVAATLLARGIHARVATPVPAGPPRR